MERKSKLVYVATALVITLAVVIGTLVAVIVAGNQSATSRVKVQYTSSDVWVRMEANYYVGSTETPLKDGSNTSIELSPINTTGSLNQVEDVVTLDKTNSRIVYEYIFTNLSDTIPAVISQTMVDDSVMVPTDTYNNVTLKYIASSTQLGAGATATSETLNSQALNPSATKYVYVVVEINDLLTGVLFEGEFGWTLTKGTAVTTSTTNSSGNKIINVNTTETGLTNATELNSIQLVMGVENEEPLVYPQVLNKAFTGWYYDSSLTNKVEWPIVVTETTTLYPKTETATEDLIYTFDDESNTYYVDYYYGSSESIIIADLYDDGTNGLAPITFIYEMAFDMNGYITNVVIPNSIISIGSYAFSNNPITSLQLGNKVEIIGEGAFYGCELTNLFIPASVTRIELSAFVPNWEYDCTIETLMVDSCNIIYSDYNCNIIVEKDTKTIVLGSKNSTIPHGIEIIGGSAFQCYNKSSITIPSSVTTICDYAFSDSKITNITIPSSVTSIGEGAFSSCSELTCITIPSSVTSIGNYTFSTCSGLTSITIPNSVTSIGSSAFSGCSGLTSITIPNSVTSIGNYAFQNCSGLTSLTIGSSTTSIGSYAFYKCSNLTSIAIPNSVTSIGNYAFQNCSGLTSLTIGDSVTSIGSSAFSGCSGLTSITIPNSVTSIGNYAFSGCSGLTSITIPNSVTSIGNYAFSGCSGLTSIGIPNSVTMIGKYAFNNCINLSSIIVPDSVVNLEEYVFNGCSNLTSIQIGTGLEQIGNFIFSGCSKLNNIVVKAGNTKYDSRDNCNAIVETSSNKLIIGCKNTIIPNNILEIGEYSFYECKNLTSITIPDSVTRIANQAFQNCSGLNNLQLGNGNMSIGWNSFYGCTSLINLFIPKKVNFIAVTSFNYCKNLVSIVVDSENTVYDSRDNCNAIIHTSTNKLIRGCNNTIIPDSIINIGDNAFGGCSELTNVTIPDNVTIIGNSVFSNCSSLTSIIIPSNVTSIGNSAFYNCSKLTSVTFENTTGWWVSTSSTATSGTSVTISATDLSANATLLKSTHYNKYWKRS